MMQDNLIVMLRLKRSSLVSLVPLSTEKLRREGWILLIVKRRSDTADTMLRNSLRMIISGEHCDGKIKF